MKCCKNFRRRIVFFGWRNSILLVLDNLESGCLSYLIWLFLCYLLGNGNPAVSVLTGSMKPGFDIGDVLVSKLKDYRCGVPVIFNAGNGPIDVVHRIIRFDKSTGNALTKGDANQYADYFLYRQNQTELYPSDIKTVIVGIIPYFGLPSVWLANHPYVKLLVCILQFHGLFGY